jgi:hypothetical protein
MISNSSTASAGNTDSYYIVLLYDLSAGTQMVRTGPVCTLHSYCYRYWVWQVFNIVIPSSLLPHLGACSRFWSIGLIVSFLSFLIRDSR